MDRIATVNLYTFVDVLKKTKHQLQLLFNRLNSFHNDVFYFDNYKSSIAKKKKFGATILAEQ